MSVQFAALASSPRIAFSKTQTLMIHLHTCLTNNLRFVQFLKSSSNQINLKLRIKIQALKYQHHQSTVAFCLRLHMWLWLFTKRDFILCFTALPPSPFLYYFFTFYLLGMEICPAFGWPVFTDPDSRFNIWDLLSCNCEAPKSSSHWFCVVRL